VNVVDVDTVLVPDAVVAVIVDVASTDCRRSNGMSSVVSAVSLVPGVDCSGLRSDSCGAVA